VFCVCVCVFRNHVSIQRGPLGQMNANELIIMNEYNMFTQFGGQTRTFDEY
jgi:hypothetical protein